MLTFGLITCSDTRDESDDTAGQALKELIASSGSELVAYKLVSDEFDEISSGVKDMCDKYDLDVVITCGGTGLSLRDVTPEATKSVCDRDVPGIAEYMRNYGLKYTENAVLSRGVCMQRGKTIVVNFPGSKRAATQNWEAIESILPHAIKMANGGGH